MDYSAVTGLNESKDSLSEEEESDDSETDDEAEDGSKGFVSGRRPKDESKEAKAERKKACKEAKAEKRKEKVPKHVKKRKEKSNNRKNK